MADIFNERPGSGLPGLRLINSSTAAHLDIEQQPEDMVSADMEQSVVQTSRKGMSPPPDNALLEIQDIAPHVEDHPQEQLVRPSEEQSAMQDVDMFHHQIIHCRRCRTWGLV